MAHVWRSDRSDLDVIPIPLFSILCHKLMESGKRPPLTVVIQDKKHHSCQCVWHSTEKGHRCNTRHSLWTGLAPFLKMLSYNFFSAHADLVDYYSAWYELQPRNTTGGSIFWISQQPLRLNKPWSSIDLKETKDFFRFSLLRWVTLFW